MIHNIAHRGASAYEPENTLRAFEKAIEMGATMIELDIHLSSDGCPMVVHDANLARTTNGAGLVTQHTRAEIQRLDAGQGEKIPTLAEAIDLVRGRAGLYIEMKGQHTPGPMIKVLRATDFLDQAIAGSFYPWLPQKAKFLEPKIRTSILISSSDRESDYIDWALAVGADYVHPCWERVAPEPHKLLTPDLISAIRRRNLGIVLWHEERPSELQELVQMDIDGICTNTPDILASILRAAG